MNIDSLRLLLGELADSYTDEQLRYFLQEAHLWVKDYCNREPVGILEITSIKIAANRLLRMGTEGLASQSYSGVSESYIDGLPADILATLNANRKIKVVKSHD